MKRSTACLIASMLCAACCTSCDSRSPEPSRQPAAADAPATSEALKEEPRVRSDTEGDSELQRRFPDYQPKLTPDMVLDYRPAIAEKLANLPASTLENLPGLLRRFDEQARLAAANPGAWQPGNMILGADEKEYSPSDYELVAAELGGRIASVVGAADADALARTLAAAGIERDEVAYRAFDFRHIDAMGSGRFFYTSAPIPKTIQLRKKR
jgi:hypothetical protein